MKANYMKKSFLVAITLCSAQVFAATTFVAEVPGEYIGEDKDKTYLRQIVVEKGKIKKYLSMDEKPVGEVVHVKSKHIQDDPKTENEIEVVEKYDVVYPGLIDLHNHTKQNIIGAWGDAKGQFANRFEWRAWSVYKKSVSGNMNPWIGLGTEINCAAFRWSEMQAMVLGTTFLQGPHYCDDDFLIHQVEDRKAYGKSKQKGVQGPTDLILPAEMTFVWDEVRPVMSSHERYNSYGKAITKVISDTCPSATMKELLAKYGPAAALEKDVVKKLSKKSWLMQQCGLVNKDGKTAKQIMEEKVKAGEMHEKFVRYVYYVHKSIVGKIEYLKDPKSAAVIGHLAEGRRNDPYNTMEFKLFDLIFGDLAKQTNVNFVHAVGVQELERMAELGIGLIWSPFSNLLLYGETADIKKAKELGINIALGSDWTPTGSRGVLEELKLAKSYIIKHGLENIFTDEELYKMVTENPARMINHFHSSQEAGIGTLVEKSLATFIAVKKINENPYTNLVDAPVQNVDLVVVDGKIMYGDKTIVSQVTDQVEVISNKVFTLDIAKSVGDDKIAPPPKRAKKAQETQFLIDVATQVAKLSLESSDRCGFLDDKVMVHQYTVEDGVVKNTHDKLEEFTARTGLNLDRFEDINKLLAFNLLTYSRNLTESSGDIDYAMTEFPPLFSCDDEWYQVGGWTNVGVSKEELLAPNVNTLFDFVSADPDDTTDKFSVNQLLRPEIRAAQGHGSKPKRMAKDYGLKYDKSEANY